MNQSNEDKKPADSMKKPAERTHQRQSSTITDDGIMSAQAPNSLPLPLPPASAPLTPVSQTQTLYLSSASSSAKSPMLTIDTVAMNTNSNSNTNTNPSTRTQQASSDFFIAYDSDTSGSSFIHHQPTDLTSTSSYGSTGSAVSTRPRRDRFPSFDSHASSGSIRYTNVSPKPPDQRSSNPRLMPYAERKKLQQQLQQPQLPLQMHPQQMQQQQQQQQQHPNLKQPPNQQQVPHQGQYPPNMMMMMPPPPPHGQMPYGNVMDPQAAAAAFYGIYGFLPPHQPPGFPPPPQQQSPQQQHPPHQPGFPPGFMMPPPPPLVATTGGQQQQHQRQQQRSNHFPQPYPMPFYPPPNNLPQQFPQHQQQQALQQQLQLQAQQRRSSQNSNTLQDRLPPSAGPKARPRHVREDSHGSMSSLGSVGGEDSDNNGSAHRRNSSGSNNSGFFTDVFNSSNSNKKKKKKKNNQVGTIAPPTPNSAAPPASPFAHRVSPRISTDSPRSSLHEDRPPASRGTHKRLASITNDEWDASSGDEDRDTIDGGGLKKVQNAIVDENSSFSGYSSSDASLEDADVNERTSLLPPSGISTNEQEASDSRKSRKSGKYNSSERKNNSRRVSAWDPNQPPRRRSGSDYQQRKSSRRKKKKKSRRRAGNEHIENSDSSDSTYDYRRWTMERARMLEKEREQVHRQWKAEYLAETERVRQKKEQQSVHRRCFRCFTSLRVKSFRFITTIEMFIANLPAAIGAVAMAFATLGVVWFKFTEENLQTCERVHFHSSQCTFPEFPGCFYCDTTVPMYQVAVNFHYGCNVLAGVLAFLFVAKVMLATRVVIDEMASPVTASPAGLLCMTTVCVFAGRGLIGQIMVSLAATVHLGLVIWYIYMALAYQIMPEPTWFPNTIGIGLTAVKTWLYYPMPGHLLMAISLSLNIFFFPISLIRVAINEKISATVGWMQMSAPALSLYALTIMAQPSFEEENPDVTNFQRVHRMIYLPCMHFMCALSLIGFFASCHSLWSRWGDLKKIPFSPAHSAFCFPTLSHANAIQSYRGAVLTFSEVKPHDWRLIILYAYWFVVLLGGTIATFWISTKFLYNLPKWTNLDLADEEEPPAPSETILSLQEMITAGETMRQPFVSPAVLQANETGALVLTRTGPEGTLKYVRTRRLLALGFEPTMKWSEMQKEREVLLEWVGKNPPRRRHRTLSVPGIDFSYGSTPSSNAFGTGNRGIYGGYGSFSPLPPARRRVDSMGGGW